MDAVSGTAVAVAAAACWAVMTTAARWGRAASPPPVASVGAAAGAAATVVSESRQAVDEAADAAMPNPPNWPSLRPLLVAAVVLYIALALLAVVVDFAWSAGRMAAARRRRWRAAREAAKLTAIASGDEREGDSDVGSDAAPTSADGAGGGAGGGNGSGAGDGAGKAGGRNSGGGGAVRWRGRWKGGSSAKKDGAGAGAHGKGRNHTPTVNTGEDNLEELLWQSAVTGGAPLPGDVHGKARRILGVAALAFHTRLRRIRRRVQAFESKDGKLVVTFLIIRTSLTLLVSVTYVVGTYRRRVETWYRVIFGVVGSLMSVDFLVHLLTSEVPWHYMLRWPNLLHCAALPSLFLVADDNQWLNFGFLIAATGYDSSRRLLRLFMLDYGSQRLLLHVLFQTLLFLFLVAGSVQLIEIASNADPAGEGPGVFLFFSAFYFTVVTASTVGYGDMSPKSFYGRAFVLLAIFGGVIFFSKLVGELVANSAKLRGSGALHKRPGAAHVILGGDPSLDDVALFAKEFFSLASNRRRKICVMVSEPSWSSDDWHRLVRTCTLYRNYLTYLAGCAMSREDLDRARLESADAYFLLQSSCSSNPQAQDTSLLMRALSIRNVRADVPVYAVCLLEDSRVQMWHAIQHGSESARAIRSAHATRSPLLNDLYRMSESELRSPLGSLVDWTVNHAQGSGTGPPDSYPTRSVDSLLSPAAKVRPLLNAPSADSVGSAGGGGTSNLTRTGSVNESTAASSIMALAVSLKTGEPLDALTRSQVVCLQSVRMTLLAENVHCNGLSTLLSNCILDIRPSRHARSGASAWLREYTDGAACSLCHCIIPHSFHGQTVAQVATPLYDQGVILLGVKRPHDRCFSLTVNVQGGVLSAGTVALVLTYNNAEDLQAVMFDVAERYEAARTQTTADSDPSPPPPHVAVDLDTGPEPPGQQPALKHVAAPLGGAGDANASMDRKYTTDRQEGLPQGGIAQPAKGRKQHNGADGAGGTVAPTRGHVRRFSAPSQGSRLVSPSPLPDASTRASKEPGSTVTDGSSSSTPAAGGGRDKHSFVNQTNTVAGIKGLPLRKYLSELRPVVATSLRHHVIICFDGAVQLLNLRLLLAMLCRRSSPYVPLLVMHPDGAGEAAARIRTELGLHGVELLSGSPTSPASWHRAAFSRARAVINMTDLSSQSLTNDDKTLFTDVTIETMTEESSDIYVQSELMKEDALEFLREPVHARRRGAHLGGTVASVLTEQLQGMLSSEPARDRERDTTSSPVSGDASSSHSELVSDRQRQRTPQASTDGSASDAQARPSQSLSNAGSSEGDQPGGGGGGGGGDGGGGDRRIGQVTQLISSSGRSHPNAANRISQQSRRVPGVGGTRPSNDQGGDESASDDDLQSLDEEEESSKISSLSSYGSQGVSTEKVLERDRRSRGLLFERARYASGELVVHSVMQTLLVRDFTASGFAAAIMTLMGVPGYTSRPLIRQLPVCRHWYEAFQRRAGLAANGAPTLWDAPAPSGPSPATGRPPTFRDVFTTLLSVQVVAIGLYRSGEAPVLMPIERREERGRRVSGRAGGHSGIGSTAAANANIAEEKLPCELDYTIGTTGEQRRYAALGAARNKLPYVSTLPEPYAIVSQEDAVFVLAPEELKIPARWPLLPAPPPMQ
ncbi:hypothetical protein MMPV_005746 [Pyropia vietnamensis]